MNDIAKLKEQIKILSANEKFIHHQWFVKWHLEIVEKIALELCEIYKNADRDLVLALVWIHDYAKIINYTNQDDKEMIYWGKRLLDNLGFDKKFIEKLIDYMHIFEDKSLDNLSKAPIEVQIVSSSDGASHFVGPFGKLFFYENANRKFDELLESDIKKMSRDWNKKIILPEVKQGFRKYYDFSNFSNGILPNKFLA